MKIGAICKTLIEAYVLHRFTCDIDYYSFTQRCAVFVAPFSPARNTHGDSWSPKCCYLHGDSILSGVSPTFAVIITGDGPLGKPPSVPFAPEDDSVYERGENKTSPVNSVWAPRGGRGGRGNG